MFVKMNDVKRPTGIPTARVAVSLASDPIIHVIDIVNVRRKDFQPMTKGSVKIGTVAKAIRRASITGLQGALLIAKLEAERAGHHDTAKAYDDAYKALEPHAAAEGRKLKELVTKSVKEWR